MVIGFKPLALCAVITLSACQAAPKYSKDGPKVTQSDFSPLLDKDWTGTLKYNDYSSGKLVTIASNASIDKLSDEGLKYTISYPDEPWEDSRDILKISNDGRMLGGHVISAIDRDGDNFLMTTTHLGEDNNRKATIRNSYSVSPGEFSIRKDIKFNEAQTYIMRNIYEFSSTP